MRGAMHEDLNICMKNILHNYTYFHATCLIEIHCIDSVYDNLNLFSFLGRAKKNALVVQSGDEQLRDKCFVDRLYEDSGSLKESTRVFDQ